MVNQVDSTSIIVIVVSLLAGFVIAFFILQGKKDSSNLKTIPSSDKIADVSVGLKKEQAQQTSAPSSSNDDKVLSPSQFRSFKVLKVTKVSHNTKLLRFEIHPEKTLGLTIGRHITLRAEIDGNKVMRAYTPTSKTDQKGYFDLLVKCYEFGKMSSYLNQLKVGQSIEVRGPVGRFQYEVNQYGPCIGLIAGGTGITPCLQVIRSILFCPTYSKDSTKFILFYQNRTEEDILLYDELQELSQKFKHRLEIYYFLSNPNTTATSESFGQKNKYEVRGYISEAMLREYMNVESCPLVCLCGPSGFNEFLKEQLAKIGHQGKTVFVW